MISTASLESYARHVWPVQRLFANVARRCTRCIVSERYTPLVSGLCGECRTAGAQAPDQSEESVVGLDAFTRDVEAACGSGANGYDALLLLSGGKDSAFILQRMRVAFPRLRILCATVDNGFMSPIALGNAAHCARRVGVDHLTLRSHLAQFRDTLRESFLSLGDRGAYAVVDYADGSLIYRIGCETAANLGIPLVLGGLSWVQLQRILGTDGYELPSASGPRVLFPLAVWRAHEQTIRARVRELGLIEPGNDSPLRTNSTLVLAMCVVDVLRLGYCSFEPEFAQLVREGKTERRLWLHIFEIVEHQTRTGRLQREADRILAQLDLSLAAIAGAGR